MTTRTTTPDFYDYLMKQSYDELWTIAIHHLGLPNYQINSISQKSYLATVIFENCPTISGECKIHAELRLMKADKRSFRRARRLAGLD